MQLPLVLWLARLRGAVFGFGLPAGQPLADWGWRRMDIANAGEASARETALAFLPEKQLGKIGFPGCV